MGEKIIVNKKIERNYEEAINEIAEEIKKRNSLLKRYEGIEIWLEGSLSEYEKELLPHDLTIKLHYPKPKITDRDLMSLSIAGICLLPATLSSPPLNYIFYVLSAIDGSLACYSIIPDIHKWLRSKKIQNLPIEINYKDATS